MTYPIVSREDLAPLVHLLRIRAFEVAAKAKPGQFAMLRVKEGGERIPLTLVDWQDGEVTFVFKEVGKTTRLLATLGSGDSIANLIGPLGTPSRLEKYGTVICVADGRRLASAFPILRGLKQAGNTTIALVGLENKRELYWEERFRKWSDRLVIATRDGSLGKKGTAAGLLAEMLKKDRADLVVAVGTTDVMQACAEATRPLGIPTRVSLITRMVDGIGICGGCRVLVGGETKLVCVDGPEFNGHQVDWGNLISRQLFYQEEEALSLELWLNAHREAPHT